MTRLGATGRTLAKHPSKLLNTQTNGTIAINVQYQVEVKNRHVETTWVNSDAHNLKKPVEV